MLTHAERVEASERELAALRDTFVAGPMDVVVPTCPEWILADLAAHVGWFCGFWTHILCDGIGRERTPFREASRHDPNLVDWFTETAEQLTELLRITPPETEVWTWYKPDQSVGFVARRCAHELAIHLYDAQAARDTREPIAPQVAADGIDEMVEALVFARRGESAEEVRTIHLHGTDDDLDGDAEWLLTLHPDRVDVARTHAKGDLALRGSVSDIELLLYQRPTLGSVERFGDESLLDAWYRRFTF